MNRMVKSVLLMIAAVISASILVSCGPEALGMYPAYVGEEVTSTDHEFSNEDFYVIVAFDDGTDRVVKDFEIGEIKREAGEYVIDIRYENVNYPVFVPINVAVYPSEMNNAE